MTSAASTPCLERYSILYMFDAFTDCSYSSTRVLEYRAQRSTGTKRGDAGRVPQALPAAVETEEEKVEPVAEISSEETVTEEAVVEEAAPEEAVEESAEESTAQASEDSAKGQTEDSRTEQESDEEKKDG